MDEIISSHVVEFVGVIVIYCSALDLFLKNTSSIKFIIIRAKFCFPYIFIFGIFLLTLLFLVIQPTNP